MRVLIHIVNVTLILVIVQLFFSDWVLTRVRGKSPGNPLWRLPREARFSIGLGVGMLLSFGCMGIFDYLREPSPVEAERVELTDITIPSPVVLKGGAKPTDPVSVSIEKRGDRLVEERTLRDGTVWRRVAGEKGPDSPVERVSAAEVVVDGGHRSGRETRPSGNASNARTVKAVYPTREVEGARVGRIPAHAEVTILREHQSFVEVSYANVVGWIARADLE